MMSRRSLLQIAPASMITLTTTKADAGKFADPHPAWLERWRAARQAWIEAFGENEVDTVESESRWDEADRLGKLLSDTAPKSVEGIRAQIQWVVEDSRGDFIGHQHITALSHVVETLQ